jgi:hypothetical protein
MGNFNIPKADVQAGVWDFIFVYILYMYIDTYMFNRNLPAEHTVHTHRRAKYTVDAFYFLRIYYCYKIIVLNIQCIHT